MEPDAEEADGKDVGAVDADGEPDAATAARKGTA